MSGYSVHNEPAYVVDSQPYRETSAFVRLFTLNHGVVRLLAKGVRGKKKTPFPYLQPGIPLLVAWAGRSDLKHLVSAETASNQMHGLITLPGEYQYALLYINELLIAFFKDDEPNPVLFSFYCETLASLTERRALPVLVRRFELSLFDTLGLGIQLDTDCRTGERVRPDDFYTLDGVQGVTWVSPEFMGSPKVRGASLLALHQGGYNVAVAQEARQITRTLIDLHLDGKRLKSRELYRRLKELKNGSKAV